MEEEWGRYNYSLCKTYTTNVCQRIEELFNVSLKTYETLMASKDHPETEDSGILNHDDHSRY